MAVSPWLLFSERVHGDSLPTEPDVLRPAPASPNTPTAAPPAPKAPTPSADNRRSFVWTEDGVFTILPNPPGVLLVSAYGINDDGEVVGSLIMDASVGTPICRGFKRSAQKGFTCIVVSADAATYVREIDGRGNVVGYTAHRCLRGICVEGG